MIHKKEQALFSLKKKNVFQNVVCCCCDWCITLPASEDKLRLLITFANSLDPDQAQQNWPDLEPNCLTLWWYSWKIFLKKKKKIKKKKSADDEKACKITQHAKS